ncbi:MAG: hypothetical protein AMXMBFR8_12750 [Nevskiales bacterium]
MPRNRVVCRRNRRGLRGGRMGVPRTGLVLRGLLPRYFELPLTLPERTRAEREGWILGVG